MQNSRREGLSNLTNHHMNINHSRVADLRNMETNLLSRVADLRSMETNLHSKVADLRSTETNHLNIIKDMPLLLQDTISQVPNIIQEGSDLVRVYTFMDIILLSCHLEPS